MELGANSPKPRGWFKLYRIHILERCSALQWKDGLAVLLRHFFTQFKKKYTLLIYICVVLWIWEFHENIFFWFMLETVNLILSFEFPPVNSTVYFGCKIISYEGAFFSSIKQEQTSCKSEYNFVCFVKFWINF